MGADLATNVIAVSPRPGERTMDRLATVTAIRWAAGRDKDNAETRRILPADLDSLAEELAGPSPTPAVKLLAQTAALDWHVLRMWQAQEADLGGRTVPEMSRRHRLAIDHTHRRLMRTLKTLATVERLSRPAVQVNIGANQVNVVGGAAESCP